MIAAVTVALGAAGVQWTGGAITTAGLLLALGALGCEAAFSLLAAPHLARLGPLACPPTPACWRCRCSRSGAWRPAGPTARAQRGGGGCAAYLGLAVTTGGFLAWYTAVGLLGVERAGLFSGLLPVSALACSAAIGAAEVTPARLAAVAVVAPRHHSSAPASARAAGREDPVRLQAEPEALAVLAQRRVEPAELLHALEPVGDRVPVHVERAGRGAGRAVVLEERLQRGDELGAVGSS